MTLARRKITPGYIVFYILFLPDTWQLSIGVLSAAVLGPAIASAQFSAMGNVVLYGMLAAIGYAVSAVPARRFAQWLRKSILGDRQA